MLGQVGRKLLQRPAAFAITAAVRTTVKPMDAGRHHHLARLLALNRRALTTMPRLDALRQQLLHDDAVATSPAPFRAGEVPTMPPPLRGDAVRCDASATNTAASSPAPSPLARRQRSRRRRTPPPAVLAAAQRLLAQPEGGRSNPPAGGTFSGEFWRRTTAAFRDVPAELFLCPAWQQRHSVSGKDALAAFITAEVAAGAVAAVSAEEADARAAAFCSEVTQCLEQRPMKVKLTPYVLALIDWANPYADPLRRQFIPVQRELRPDHPATQLDSLAERASLAGAGETGIVHRYPDKVLLLANSTCPVYCQYCTRSYAIGPSTGAVAKKHKYVHQRARWLECVDYVATNEAVRDVTISGGDASMLSGADLRFLGDRLLAVPHVQYVRVATKALAINPMKVYDAGWLGAVVELHAAALARGKELFVHTHFQHAREVTPITADCVRQLRAHNITIRNQSVAIRGVNDTAAAMQELVERLVDLHIRPYYVYAHDMVPGCEHLRTTLGEMLQVEKQLQGFTSGYNLPRFIVDLPGGGGKTNAWAFEHYQDGVATYYSAVTGRSHEYHDPAR